MFEHIWDSSVFQKELITSRPHLALTIYDETAILARRVTGLDFKHVLLYEQILFRALAIWGVYLICRRFAESPPAAMLIAALVSLGATIVGPAVLSFEYEPVPRGFAISLLLCAIGFVIHGEILWASIAASAAFLYHAPTTVPFWILFAVVVLRTRRWSILVPPLAAALILGVLSELQPGLTERQHFFSRIPPVIEQLQRFRAPYNWITLWPREYFGHYLIVSMAGAAAFYRVRDKLDFNSRLFLAGLPIIGLISVAASYVLLDVWKWALIPQWQPARAVLFVTLSAVILCAVAGAEAAVRRRPLESFLWFLLPVLIPIHRTVWWPYPAAHIVLILGLAALAALSLAAGRAAPLGIAATFLAAVGLAPTYGGVENYARIHSPALDQLSDWARTKTPKNAVFLFPDPGKDLRPGIFRAQALRAVYVDWKAGGQVNYFDDLGIEWWNRWQRVASGKEIPPDVDYVVFKTGQAPQNVPPAFRNDAYTVIRLEAAALAFR
jgi:hypothetical protein